MFYDKKTKSGLERKQKQIEELLDRVEKKARKMKSKEGQKVAKKISETNKKLKSKNLSAEQKAGIIASVLALIAGFLFQRGANIENRAIRERAALAREQAHNNAIFAGIGNREFVINARRERYGTGANGILNPNGGFNPGFETNAEREETERMERERIERVRQREQENIRQMQAERGIAQEAQNAFQQAGQFNREVQLGGFAEANRFAGLDLPEQKANNGRASRVGVRLPSYIQKHRSNSMNKSGKAMVQNESGRFGSLDLDSMPRQKRMTTFDSCPWCNMRMDKTIRFSDGKIANLIGEAKNKVVWLAKKIAEFVKAYANKTSKEFDLAGQAGLGNRIVYVLGKIAKLLGGIAAVRTTSENIKRAKELEKYSQDADEFIGALGQAVKTSTDNPAELAQAENALQEFGGKTKQILTTYRRFKASWGYLRALIYAIVGQFLEKHAIGNAQQKVNMAKDAIPFIMDGPNLLALVFPGSVFGKVITTVIAKRFLNGRMVAEIKRGVYKEPVFVKNFTNDMIVKIREYGEDERASNELIGKLRSARSIDDLLQIFPMNRDLQKINAMFKQAYKEAWA